MIHFPSTTGTEADICTLVSVSCSGPSAKSSDVVSTGDNKSRQSWALIYCLRVVSIINVDVTTREEFEHGWCEEDLCRVLKNNFYRFSG